MGANCGGLSNQVALGGKCGVCGDSYTDTEPRAHEDGGKYGKGITVGQYSPGMTISTSTQITAHHKGWFEFKLCPRNEADDYTADKLQACLDANVLQKASGGSKYYLQDTHDSTYASGGYWYDVDIVLPNITCDRCVLQWRYHAGNGWGCNGQNDCGMGKGDQEEFVNCADIQISPSGGPAVTAPPPLTTTPGPVTTLAEGAKCGPWQEQYPFAVLDKSDKTTEKTPDSCTEGGHEGMKNSRCYITCPEQFDLVWDDSSLPESKLRTSIECKWTGEWKITHPFKCVNPCPDMKLIQKDKYVKV